MPPALSGRSLSSVNRLTSSKVSIPIRTYIKSTPFSPPKQPQNHIRPESPQYVRNLPAAPQAQAQSEPIIKGTLPPPREIFHRRAADKTSKEFLEATIPEPEHQRKPINDYEAWKRRMAQSRRKNLRESIAELHKRKVEQELAVSRLSQRRSKYREKLVAAPQREDERLTSPTITTANSTFQSGALPDPNRAARVAEKKAKVKANEAAREEARKDALHTLYMNARHFVTTEEQLEAKIDEIFIEDPHERGNYNDNIWIVKKAPKTVQEMLSSIKGEEKGAIDYYSGKRPTIVTGKRVRKIAEELTGGKMD